MEIITIDNKKYSLADDIIKNTPIWCKGIRNGRELIKRKNIDEKHFIYARLVDDEWVSNEGKSVKFDKVLVRNIYLNKVEKYTSEINNNGNIADENGVEKAPEIILLDDEEKFSDNEGNVLEIETRGERECDKIFFKVKDVSDGFEIRQLHKTLIDAQSQYKIGHDYKYFICINGDSNTKKSSKKIITIKELFLTYEGILRVLFVSRSGNTKRFVDWATKKLFTLQMGTLTQKTNLVSDLLGVNATSVKDVFCRNAKTLPCVYFFTLGHVKDLRKSMNISDDYEDDDIVGMYGFTKDLTRRTTEHIKSYSKIKGCELKLKWYSYIDPQYMSSAESDVRTCMNALDSHLEYKKEKELVVLSKEYMKIVNTQYENISSKYMGHISELITQLKEQDAKHQIELANKDKIILEEQHKNELQKEKYENALLKKELEIMKLTHKKK
jgi:hypothetical protein